MNIRTKWSIAFYIFLILVLGSFIGFNIKADKGMVGINPDRIVLYEPGQKAIICWDGIEEILILSTDVRAEKATKALEILPVPSIPTIEVCNESVFESIIDLVAWYPTPGKKADGSGGTNTANAPPPEVEVVFHETLGVHNITVINAYTSGGFTTWVNNFLNDSGFTPMSFPKAESIAESYMERDINYFVLDIIELTGDLKSPEPIMYRFKSSGVYYPMEISSLTGGESHIKLFILTPFEVIKGPYETKKIDGDECVITTWQDEQFILIKISNSSIYFDKIASNSVYTDQLLNKIYNNGEIDLAMAEIYEFFEAYEEIKLGVYIYYGSVDLEGDIFVKKYSTETVMIDREEIDLSPDRPTPDTDICTTTLMIPLAILTIIPSTVVLRLRRK